MSILVTGGAGYIGSHCVKQLKELGIDVVVVDNLSTGKRKSIGDTKLYVGDLADKDFLRGVFEHEQIESVIHFAAFSVVGESMTKPDKYFRNNIVGSLTLFEIMCEFDVKNIVFSSTAAIYGEPIYTPIDEEHIKNPTNTYGESKLIIEKMLKWFDFAYGLKYVALRYFNVAGANESGKIGEAHNPETHLVPLVLSAFLGIRDNIKIFGNDYATEDGTCVRDYIHVDDLIRAHILALEYLKTNDSNCFNLGNGQGFSVKQIIDISREVTGKDINVIMSERREGDPAVLISSSDKAMKVLGWKPKHNGIEEIISSAYKWHKNYPNGYEN